MTATAPVVELVKVSAGYGAEPALEEVSLTVGPLDFLGLVGPNGGGKTTLLRVLLGLLEPSRGEVRLFGHPPATGRNRVGYVPQALRFDRDFPVRVLDVVLMGCLGRAPRFRPYPAVDRRRAMETLDQLDLGDLAARPVGELSGGQLQRVLIARALLGDPDLLLLDEPTASVDPAARGAIFDLLAELNQSLAIILVTHDMGVISSHVKTVGCLNRRLHYHGGTELTAEVVRATWQCPVDLIAHGVPHRVFAQHGPHGDHTHGGGDA